jgi:hypothetical protein
MLSQRSKNSAKRRSRKKGWWPFWGDEIG